jgi:ABC-type branched-subunit amino acid transport system ATPase component/branched-subunit amino acid ABC-type transport system permease component
MLRDLLPFVVTGLLSGTVYGLAAVGLVLTFKTSGIFNFGHGAILTAGALAYYAASVSHGLDWKVSVFLSVCVLGPLMGLVMELVARRLSRQRTAMRVVGTVGLMVLVPSICLILYPASYTGLRVERFLPFSNRQEYRIRILDVNVFGDQIVVAVIAVACVAGLYALFRFSRLGLAMRGAVDDPELLALTGTEPTRVRRIAWVIGCTFAALSGVLLVPLVNLQPYALTFLATYAFGAAAFGAFHSIPMALAGGLVVGVGADVSGFFIRDQNWTTLAGLPEAMPFLLLFVVLLLLPARRLATGEGIVERQALPYRGTAGLRAGVGLVVLGALALFPYVFERQLSYLTLGLSQAILILSLGLLVRMSGQLSLAHATFAAIGAVAFSQFTTGAGMPWLVALVLAALVTVPVGALVALPAIRLSGIYLALATFGFGILVQRLFFPQTWMFNTFAGARRMPTPAGFDTPRSVYFLVLLVLVVVAVLIAAISHSRLGRMLQGISEAPAAVSTLGLSTTVTKTIVFCLSAALAAVAGVMFGMAYSSVDSATPAFQPFNSLVLVAILAIAPFREPWYAVFAGVVAVIPGFIGGESVPHWLEAGFGFFAVVIAVQGGQRVMPARLRAFLDRVSRRRPVEIPTRAPAAPQPVLDEGERSTQGLELRGIDVSFGGLRAVDDVSLSAPLGRITGLIGPNGAGKTTTFDVVSGINRRHSGIVSFNGQDISGLSPAERGRLGLGRTFQHMELGDALTVVENVALGAEAGQAGRRFLHQLVAPPHERADMLAATHEALAMCGITHLAEAQAGSLSTGERRLVELARCLAGEFDLLLLDEPSSGLDRSETERFGAILLEVVQTRRSGILLVEHDMSLVLRVCEHIHVLDFGRLVFEGTPADVAASPVVRSAYLGEETTELHAFETDLNVDAPAAVEEQVG